MEEARHLSVSCDFGDEREVVDVVQCVVEPSSLVSAVLEAPKVIMGVPWSLLLTVVRDCV